MDIPNWDDDVYLTGGGTDASLGSRFTDLEPYAWRVIFLLMLWPCSSLSHPTAPPLCTQIPVASQTSISPSPSHHPSIRPPQICQIRVVVDSYGARPFHHTSIHPTLLSMCYSYVGFRLTCGTILLPPPLSQSNYHRRMVWGWHKQRALPHGPWEYGTIQQLIGQIGIVQLSTVRLC